MKKIILFLSIIISILFLTSCGKKNQSADIIDQKFEGNTYTLTLNVNKDLSSDETYELAYSSASEIYLQLKDKILQNKRYLNIIFMVNTEEKLKLNFVVNETIEHPGLKLLN